jgi:hypothetical protein
VSAAGAATADTKCRAPPTQRPAARSRLEGVARTSRNMKVLLWIIGIIFLIGLLVVLGLGKLIF